MEVAQAHYRLPINGPQPVAEMVGMMTERVTRAFYDDLDRRLRDAPGGLLVGQPRVSVKTDEDRLLGTGNYTTVSMSASVEELPIPPEYRFFGGPADGSILRTHGERVWLVPVAPPPPTAASYIEPNERIPQLVAEYRRQGDTAAYFYERTRER